MKSGPCAKCGSKDVADGVRLMDRGHGNEVRDLSARAQSHPKAWLFKGNVLSPLVACVCGACGFVELYVEDPREIVEAARKGRAEAGGEFLE